MRTPLFGAIRWDAWFGPKGMPGKAVEKSLGPRKWHDRLPFYAKVVSGDAVEVRGDTQEVMDREIEYAAAAGLDYWAFVTYAEGDAMSEGLALYLASAKKARIKFCLNLQGGHMAKGGAAGWAEQVKRYVGYFKDPQYVKVAGGRPLVYLFMIEHMVNKKDYASLADVRKALDALRQASKDAGAGDPYLVLQVWNPGQEKAHALAVGAEALSAYAVPGGTEPKPAPFENLRKQAGGFWIACEQTGLQVVPITAAGWDRRPRVENPVPWENGPGSAAAFEAPTPEELAAHLQDAIGWVQSHPKATAPQAILMYAWNEVDEGGYILPTLKEGTARLDALKKVLGKRK
ncbi:MAG: glycoside hydrolase family 99-like domain-containing protein [Planctomycetota bacterium]|nr:glycoside hydrolase family 99-like domain-containing protein [Planctomycetota bacterium]